MLNALQQAREGQKGRERAGRTKGTAQQNEKVKRQFDSITAEELERLSLQVKRVEREHAELLETWLIPYARDCAISGRRFSVGERCDYLAWHGVKSCSHNDQPILARVLLQRVPEARGLVELRRCRVDFVFDGRGSDAEPSLA